MPLSVPLGGADVFHLVHDRAMAREGLGSNQCALVLELQGRVNEALLERRLLAAAALLPQLRFVLEAPLFRPCRWVLGPALGARVRVVATDLPPISALSALFSERRLSGDRPWEVVVLRGPAADTLLLFWYHPYTDAKGALRLARFLGSGEGAEPLQLSSGEHFRNRPSALDSLDRGTRLSLSKAYNEHILQFSRRPIVSLRGARPGSPLGAMRFSRFVLSQAETSALDKSIRGRAKLAESFVMIRAFARVLDRVLRKAGFAPPQYLVPVPVSFDPKGVSERMFGNHLTMMMFSLDRDDLQSESRGIASLAEQQRRIVAGKLDLGMAAALELVSVLPSRLYLGLATLPFGGELSSFIFSNPGNAAIERFMGVLVTDAYAVPSVVPRPAVELIVNRHGGRVSFLLGSFDGLLAPSEMEAMMAELRSELFGIPFS